MLVIVILFWFIFFNKLLFASINEVLARSRGVRTFWLETLFSAAIAVLVTVSMSWIGLFGNKLIFGASCRGRRNIARSQKQYHMIAVSVSLFSGVSDLCLLTPKRLQGHHSAYRQSYSSRRFLCGG